MWQDYVIALAQWIFALTLLPAIFHPEQKPPFSTSASTTLILVMLAIAYISLELWVAFIAISTLTVAWGILAAQRFLINRRKGVPVIETPSFLKRK